MLKNIRNTLLASPRLLKQALAVLSDVIICAIAVQLAMDLRVETHSPWGIQHTWLLLTGLAFFIPVFISMGLYRAIFRYAGLQVIFSLNKAMVVYALLYVAVFTVFGIDQVPRSLGLLQPLIFGLGIVSSRLFVRFWLGGLGPQLEKSLPSGSADKAARPLVVNTLSTSVGMPSTSKCDYCAPSR